MPFTKEQLINHIKKRLYERQHTLGAENINPDYRAYLKAEIATDEIALAALTAEPVGYIDADYAELLGSGHIESCSVYAEHGEGCVSVYTAPPAPVVQPVQVPEWTNEQCLEFLSIAFGHAEIKGDLELDDIRLGVKMVNDSLAAMLRTRQEAAPLLNCCYKSVYVGPGRSESENAESLHTIQPASELDSSSIIAESLHADFLGKAEPVSQRDELPEGWVTVPVEPTPEMLAEICLVDGWTERALRARYKAMLAAVPQPEVK